MAHPSPPGFLAPLRSPPFELGAGFFYGGASVLAVAECDIAISRAHELLRLLHGHECVFFTRHRGSCRGLVEPKPASYLQFCHLLHCLVAGPFFRRPRPGRPSPLFFCSVSSGAAVPIPYTSRFFMSSGFCVGMRLCRQRPGYPIRAELPSRSPRLAPVGGVFVLRSLLGHLCSSPGAAVVHVSSRLHGLVGC